MPVLVTGVEDALGSITAHRLLATGGEVRVWLDAERSDDEDARFWRAAGFKATIATADDEGRLEAALEQVHTVVYAAGGPLDDPDEGTEALATLVSAALGANCRRFIWVTDLALDVAGELADPPPYVSALAERAGILDGLPMDVVVLRTGLRIGPHDRLTQAIAAHAPQLRRAVPHAPVWIEDVAAAVVAADSQRGGGLDVHLSVELVGPETLPLATVSERLATTVSVTDGVELPADVEAWLRIPAVGSQEALGREGVAFSEALRLLQAVPDGPDGGG